MTLVPRSSWGDPELLNRGWRRDGAVPTRLQGVRGVVLHHTDPDASCNAIVHERCAERVQHWFHFHLEHNRWSDLGYHLLVCPHGVVYEGRLGSFLQPVVGAHASGNNPETLGIALLGFFSEQAPTGAAVNSLKAVLKAIAAEFGVEYGKIRTWNRISAGGQVAFEGPSLLGHRDLKPTECPGEQLYQKLAQLRRLA